MKLSMFIIAILISIPLVSSYDNIGSDWCANSTHRAFNYININTNGTYYNYTINERCVYGCYAGECIPVSSDISNTLAIFFGSISLILIIVGVSLFRPEDIFYRTLGLSIIMTGISISGMGLLAITATGELMPDINSILSTFAYGILIISLIILLIILIGFVEILRLSQPYNRR